MKKRIESASARERQLLQEFSDSLKPVVKKALREVFWAGAIRGGIVGTVATGVGVVLGWLLWS